MYNRYILLFQFMNMNFSKRNAIELAIKEANKGVFISEEIVNAWVNSWGTEKELPTPNIFPNIK